MVHDIPAESDADVSPHNNAYCRWPSRSRSLRTRVLQPHCSTLAPAALVRGPCRRGLQVCTVSGLPLACPRACADPRELRSHRWRCIAIGIQLGLDTYTREPHYGAPSRYTAGTQPPWPSHQAASAALPARSTPWSGACHVDTNQLLRRRSPAQAEAIQRFAKRAQNPQNPHDQHDR